MLRYLFVCLFACAAFAQKPILVENVRPDTVLLDYLFVGMPDDDIPGTHGTLADDGRQWSWVAEPGGIRLRVENVPPHSAVRLGKWIVSEAEPPKFALHPHVAQFEGILLPVFRLGGEPGESVLDAVERESPFARLLHRRYVWRQQRVTVDLWLWQHHDHPSMEWSAHATYGDVRNDGQAQSKEQPLLTMVSAGPIYIDYARRLGLQVDPTWDAATQRFAVVYKPASVWHRARRYALSGSVLTSGNPSSRHAGYRTCALYEGWQGKWLALGQVPAVSQTSAQELAQRRARYLNQSVNAPRDRAQPENSGQTGEQPDFGASNGVAVTMAAPWEIHDALYHCQSFALRPTANREPDGSPMLAGSHPGAQTYNQRPDFDLGSDRLGWPKPIEWITGYTTSDDEHRADGLLHATYLLTRAPELAAIIEDHIQLDLTDVYLRVDRGTGAARAEGRLLLAEANQLWLGFGAARVALAARLDRVLRHAGWVNTAGPHKSFAGGSFEAKYGWRVKSATNNGTPFVGAGGRMLLAVETDQQSTPVRGGQAWQDAILLQGLLACHAVTGDQRAQDAALMLARSIVDYAFFQVCGTGAWQHVYAFRWNNGTPWGEELQTGAINDALYPDGSAAYWSAVAAVVLAARGDAKAQAIMQAWLPLRTSAQARWWALQ